MSSYESPVVGESVEIIAPPRSMSHSRQPRSYERVYRAIAPKSFGTCVLARKQPTQFKRGEQRAVNHSGW